MDQRNLVNDEFAQDKALQQWVGISYQIEDDEGTPILLDAIYSELKKGPTSLPRGMHEHFKLTEKDIENMSLQQKKQWFCTIRTQRELLDGANLLQDDFTISEPLRDWVGLRSMNV